MAQLSKKLMGCLQNRPWSLFLCILICPLIPFVWPSREPSLKLILLFSGHFYEASHSNYKGSQEQIARFLFSLHLLLHLTLIVSCNIKVGTQSWQLAAYLCFCWCDSPCSTQATVHTCSHIQNQTDY